MKKTLLKMAAIAVMAVMGAQVAQAQAVVVDPNAKVVKDEAQKKAEAEALKAQKKQEKAAAQAQKDAKKAEKEAGDCQAREG